VYEEPATAFVAGFVGTSNLLSGRGAETVLGKDGTYSIRPEKIRIDGDLSRAAPPGEIAATGTVTAAVYAGATVRYEVTLDAGGQLSVVRQNSEPVDFPDGRVRLTWRQVHNFRVPEKGQP
jgi:putative spermidine/putrescine transport system ATP-binding protein